MVLDFSLCFSSDLEGGKIMNNSIKDNITILFHMFKREMLIQKKSLFNDLIDCMIWPVIMAIAYGYLLPAVGLSGAYGGFMIVGLIGVMSFYIIFEGKAFPLAQDFDEIKRINFELALPISPRLVFVKHGLAYALHASITAFPALFLGKIVLWNIFDMSNFSFVLFSLIFVLNNVLWAFVCLWMVGFCKADSLFHMRLRLIEPLLFIGCFWCSWHTLYNVFPFLGYVMLANPLTYAMEGARAAVLGQSGFIPYWVSVGMLSFFIVLFAWLALRSLKKRLDFVDV